MYAKLVNAKLCFAQENLIEGRKIVFNYGKNPQMLKNDGFNEVEYSQKPHCDQFSCLEEVINETEEKIIVSYEVKEKTLDEVKASLSRINEQLRNVDFIQTSIGFLKTQTPLGDLKSALVLYEKAAKANNGLMAGAVRLYDQDGNITLSPALSFEGFEALMNEVVNAYIAIDQKSTQYAKSIKEAQNMEELKQIQIVY